MKALCQVLNVPQYVHKIFFIIVLLLMMPTEGRSQMMVGDPSQTLYNTGAAKIEIGGGKTLKQKVDTGRVRVTTNSNPNVTFDIPESSAEISSEQVFLKASASLGRVGDIFGTIGQARINKPIDGEYGTLIGCGLKISPPQKSVIKIGLLLQIDRYASEENNFAAYVGNYGTASDGSSALVAGTGDASEKITMTHFNAVLGFGVDCCSYVRPYAGLLFSKIDGTDELSFSGSGYVDTWPSTGGAVTRHPGQVSFSTKNNIHGDSSLSGMMGVTINPAEQIGMTFESQFGNGTSFLISTFMRF